MDKYGVEETDRPKEAALDNNQCPACGAKLENQVETGVRVCPNCGTKPFEPVEETK